MRYECGREMKSDNSGQESTTAPNTPSFPLDQCLMIVSECVAVSYTHLTLPTNREGEMRVVADAVHTK